MLIRTMLPVWLRKKRTWAGLFSLFLLCFVIWLIFGLRLGPFYLRSWLRVGFLQLHIGKIALIVMSFLVVLFLWAADRMLASPNENNRKHRATHHNETL